MPKFSILSALALVLFPGFALAQLATPNADGITFGHVHVNVTDPAEHARLYEEFFDGEIVLLDDLTVVQFPNMLLFLNEQPPSRGSRETVMDHFGFKVRDIASFIERWEASGREMGRVFIGAEGQTNAYVTLPDGVYVELQEDQSLHEEVTGYHVHFFTADYEDLLTWYTEVFELEVRPRGSIGTTTNVPGMNLSFSNSRDPRTATLGTAIDHIGFEIENLEAFCQRLAAKGIEFDTPYQDYGRVAAAYLTDPNGVRLELTEGLERFALAE